MRTPHRPSSPSGAPTRGFGEPPVAGRSVRMTAWCLPPGNAARRARSLLRSQLSGHVTDRTVLDDLDVIVCELATNAGRHTAGPCEIRIIHYNGIPVICEIADTGDGLDRIARHLHPPATGPGPADTVITIATLTEGGRGLHIVACLTEGHCGVRTSTLCGTGRPGKSIWFAIPATPAVPVGPAGTDPATTHQPRHHITDHPCVPSRRSKSRLLAGDPA